MPTVEAEKMAHSMEGRDPRPVQRTHFPHALSIGHGPWCSFICLGVQKIVGSGPTVEPEEMAHSMKETAPRPDRRALGPVERAFTMYNVKRKRALVFCQRGGWEHKTVGRVPTVEPEEMAHSMEKRVPRPNRSAPGLVERAQVPHGLLRGNGPSTISNSREPFIVHCTRVPKFLHPPPSFTVYPVIVHFNFLPRSQLFFSQETARFPPLTVKMY